MSYNDIQKDLERYEFEDLTNDEELEASRRGLIFNKPRKPYQLDKWSKEEADNEDERVNQ